MVAGVKGKAKFGVTRLSGVSLVLGYPWLKEQRVVLDFGRSTITSSQPHIKTRPPVPSLSLTSSSSSPSTSSSTSVPSLPGLLPTLANFPPLVDSKEVLRATKAALRDPHEVHCIPNGKLTRPNNIELGQPCKWNAYNPSSSTQIIESLNGATDSPFLGDIDNLHTLPSFSEVAADLTADKIAESARLVPQEYSKYVDFFHPRLATESLTPSCVYDLKIELQEDAQLRAAPLYELSPMHLSVLKETIDRERAAGRIRPSNAPYGSPTFFVPKSGG